MKLRSLKRGWWAVAALALAAAGPAAGADSADLGLKLGSGLALPSVGRTLALLVSVTNRGPDAASAVIVSSPLPATASYVGASASQGTAGLVEGLVVGDLGTLAPNAAATMT